jgi:P27 family predicted phage terminase small subunit
MQGRKPKPTKISPGTTTLEPPSHLPAEVAAVWRRLVEEFSTLRVLGDGDRPALEVLATHLTEWRACVAAGREQGRIVKVHGQDVPNPWMALAMRHEAIVCKLLPEFGATPSSRSRLNIKAIAQEAPDEFDQPMRIAQ